MLCIIAGHFGIASANHFVYTFHVPLFFLLSGYFLSTKVSFLPFMKQKARQLLVPYYVTGVVILVVATVVNHFVWPEIDALNNAKSMLGALLYGSGAPHSEPFAIRQIGLLWFLWALFFSTGFTHLALKTKYPLLTVCLIAAAGWASSKVTWLPLSIQPGAMASFFMYLGFLARKHGILDKKPPGWLQGLTQSAEVNATFAVSPAKPPDFVAVGPAVPARNRARAGAAPGFGHADAGPGRPLAGLNAKRTGSSVHRVRQQGGPQHHLLEGDLHHAQQVHEPLGQEGPRRVDRASAAQGGAGVRVDVARRDGEVGAGQASKSERPLGRMRRSSEWLRSQAPFCPGASGSQ